jgi:muramoyltetrapeptide carboxypeptidase
VIEIIPPFIKKGALFGLVSPAGKISAGMLDPAEQFLSAHGFRSIRSRHATDAFFQFSASDQHRLEDLQSMIDHPDVDVIWCTRGGYGAIRILEQIDFSAFKHRPKWLVGFSDITVFHSALQNIHKVASVHGPMPKSITQDGGREEALHLLNLLQGHSVDYLTQSHPLNREGSASGTLIGGNLSLLYALRGTQYDFDPRGKVLFIEEVGEKLYHLDRMMHNLKLGGQLAGLSGLIVGQMTEMTDEKTPFGASVQGVVREAVKGYGYPVLFGFPAGHDSPNEPLILGGRVHLQVNALGGRVIENVLI